MRKLRVFISSSITELAYELEIAARTIENLRLEAT